MALEHSPQAIPNYLIAATPMGLRRKMLSKNAQLGGWVRYSDIGQVEISGRLVFICWFYEAIQTNEQINEIAGEK